MHYDDLTIQKLRELSILDVAEKLGFRLTGFGDECRRAICPYHDDQHPSLHFSKRKGIFKCFVCGAKGDLFKLVMDTRCCTFVEACDWLVSEFHVVVIPPEPSVVPKSSVSSVQSVVSLPSDLVRRSLSQHSQFCQSVVSAGYLTDSQLRRAADRYRLGSTRDGGVIFWEIDDRQRVRTGKIMYYQSDCHRDKQHAPTWVHALMKDKLPAGYELRHCLFGMHLLSNTDHTDLSDNKFSNSQILDKSSSVSSVQSVVCIVDLDKSSSVSAVQSVVCIVESEKTAVILSEVVPDSIWLSCGGLQMFKPELLAPLVNHKVVIFPDTDLTGDTYRQWLAVVQQAAKCYPFRHPLRISRLLEDHASPDQKQRKIDLADFLFE